MVLLEDLDVLLDAVHCSNERISLTFTNSEQAQHADSLWGAVPEFFVVTAHPGCNEFNQRQSFS